MTSKEDMVLVILPWIGRSIDKGDTDTGEETKEEFIAGLALDYERPDFNMQELVTTYVRVIIMDMKERDRIKQVRDIAIQMIKDGKVMLPEDAGTIEDYSMICALELQEVDEFIIRETLFAHMFIQEMENRK